LIAEVASTGDSSCASWGDDIVDIRSGGVRRKFNIGHEMGHMLYMKYRGGKFPFDCQLHSEHVGELCKTLDASHGSHAIHTEEFASSALGEGFAHFVASDVFNDHSEANGSFNYDKTLYDPLINFETGPAGGVSRFLETNCEEITHRGVELDWLGAFWNYLGLVVNHNLDRKWNEQ
jgi:hypothetical protein